MSYYISAYLVDLDKLRGLYGSGNAGIAVDIERQFSEEIDRLDEYIDENWDIETPSVIEVLRSNIAGIFPWSYNYAPYKEVLELLCRYYGKELPNDVFWGLSPYGVKFIEEEAADIGDIVFRSTPPVFIPGMEDETMYRVGHISHDRALLLLHKRVFVKGATENDDMEWEEQAYLQFYEWLELAAETHQGIVTFFK